MVNTKSGLVGVAGLGLVAVNFWTSDQKDAINGVLWDKKDPDQAHKALLGIAGELLLVGLLVLVASASESLGNGMLAALAALWIIWGIHHYSGGK